MPSYAQYWGQNLGFHAPEASTLPMEQQSHPPLSGSGGVFGDLSDHSLCLDFFPTSPSFSVYYPSSSIQWGGATPKKAFEKNELAQGKLTVSAMQIDYDFKQKLSICYTLEWL